jgi:mannose-6-phosphate isomerase-like protein (cupin superfamily)
MLEQVFTFQRTDQQVIEKVVDPSDTGHPHIIHGILPPGQATPHQETSAEVHLIVVRGTLALRVADQIIHTYETGTIVAVPLGVMLEARSAGPDCLEFFAIETAPAQSLASSGVQP